MENEHALELLVINYNITGNEVIFNEIYNTVTEYTNKRITGLSRKYNIDSLEVESVINFKIFQVVKAFDKSKGTFMKQLNTAIRNGCIDALRKDAREKSDNLSFLNKDDSPDFMDKLAPTGLSAEINAIENLQKDREQRQLLANLTVKVDDNTRQSVIAFLDAGSYGEAAKLLGVNKGTIQRRIKRIARYFDANQMGQVTDYFTVPTVKAV